MNNKYHTSFRFCLLICTEIFILMFSLSVISLCVFLIKFNGDVEISLIISTILICFVTVLIPIVVITVVLIPFYPIVIGRDIIKGYDVIGRRVSCEWSDIKSAKIKRLGLITRYVYLYDDERNNPIVLPFKGLTNYQGFVKEVESILGADHEFTRCLKGDF